MRTRICVVTGSRSDYGLLYWPMKLLSQDPEIELQIAVTGMHLSPSFGESWRTIEGDGFSIAARVEMLLSGDSCVSVAKSVGIGVMGFADAIEHLKPDLMMVLGDRFEILAAVQAALFARVPVAHVCGGDVTEGAFDDSIRHAITKMAHLHFPSNSDAARRIVAMGEDPAHVYTVGSPGLDRIRQMRFLDRNGFFEAIGHTPRSRNILVAFHPATLDSLPISDQVEELLAALSALGPDTGMIITGSNADTAGQYVSIRLREFTTKRDGTAFHVTLGSDMYLNAMQHVDAIVGNSSSGLYETPAFGIPAVNIGDRQKGRPRASNVIDCRLERGSIHKAILQALATKRRPTWNPYGEGYASEGILKALKTVPDYSALICKKFVMSGMSNK